MCFVLYAGTSKPIHRKNFDLHAPDVSVEALSDREEPVRAFFGKPEVQYVGSTSQCGCDFGSVMFQNGEWPWWDDGEGSNPEHEGRERQSREGLVSLLKGTGEEAVELYGEWDGGHGFPAGPRIREEIFVTDILDRRFRFKEQGFYTVQVETK